MSTLWDAHEVTFWVVGSRTYPEKVLTCRMPGGVTIDRKQAYGHIFLDPEEAQKECDRKNAQLDFPSCKVLEFDGTLKVYVEPEPARCSNCGELTDAIYDEGRCLDCLCHECGVPLDAGVDTICDECVQKQEDES